MKENKVIASSWGKLNMEASILENSIIKFENYFFVTPKNEAEREQWRKQPYVKMEYVGDGKYKVSQVCSISIEMLKKIMPCLKNDKDGDFYWRVDE